MARSLTIKHEEKPSTSYLLNFFLALAFGWLMLSALAAAASSGEGVDAALGGDEISNQ